LKATVFLLFLTCNILGFQVGLNKYRGGIGVGRSHQLARKQDQRDTDILDLEEEVKASAQVQLDLKRVSEALDFDPSNLNPPNSPSITASRFQIALAAASVTAAAVFVTIQSFAIAGISFAGIFIVAAKDPMEEDGAIGPGARLLGRAAINSFETTAKPKLKAVARAAITSEKEISNLQKEIHDLKEANAKLQQWKEQRIAVDQNQSKYTLDELKSIAKDHNLPVGGTKPILMMRLLENEVLEL
jgi:hypothetical protein